jgi:hypothetical protein
METVVVGVSIQGGVLSTPVVEVSWVRPDTRVAATKEEEGSRVVMASKGEATRLRAAGLGLAMVAIIHIKVHLIILVWEAGQILCKERVAAWGHEQ